MKALTYRSYRWACFFSRILFALLFLAAYGSAGGQALQEAARKLYQDPALKSASVSISVQEVGNNAPVFQYLDTLTRIPASIQKLVTTAIAWDLLGSEFRFQTCLGYRGTISPEGVLQGDLHLLGGGDPTLGSEHFAGQQDLPLLFGQMLAKLQARGIRRIEGNLIADISRYGSDVQGHAWPQNDLGNYYGAGIFGLNAVDNKFNIRFKQNQSEGALTSVEQINPWIEQLQIQNEVRTGPAGSGDNAYVFGSAWSDHIFIRGTIPPGTGTFRIKAAIPNPPAWLADSLKRFIQSNGIDLTGRSQVYGLAPQEKVLTDITWIDTLRSPSLAAIVKLTNSESINLFSEALLLALDPQSPMRGQREAGIRAVYRWLRQQRIDTSGLFYQDGSGLSPRNGLTARQLTQVLCAAGRHLGTDFEMLLPEAGSSGTVKNLLKNSPHKSRIHLKSGSMDRVRNYAGYVRTSRGKWLAFSILLNDYTGRSSALLPAIERFLEQLAAL